MNGFVRYRERAIFEDFRAGYSVEGAQFPWGARPSETPPVRCATARDSVLFLGSTRNSVLVPGPTLIRLPLPEKHSCPLVRRGPSADFFIRDRHSPLQTREPGEETLVHFPAYAFVT